MRPIFATLALLVAACSAARAQPPIEPVNGVITVPLTVTPRPAKPLTQVRLLPDFRDRVPGNRVQGFMKVFFEQRYYFFDPEVQKQDEKNREAPLSSPELKKVAANESQYGPPANAAYAARMTAADWQIDEILKREGYRTLLPEVQQMRLLASKLQIHARSQLANGRPLDALETACTLFALARTFQTQPTLIGGLVGVAIGSIACQVLEEVIQHPDCPNLYWALTSLPTPFLNMHENFGGEYNAVGGEAGPLYRAEQVAGEGQLAAMLRELEVLFNLGPSAVTTSSVTFRALYAIRAANAALVAKAREKLVAAGKPDATVGQLPPLQAILAAEYADYVAILDTMSGYAALPPAQSLPLFDALDDKLRGGGRVSMFLQLPPSTAKIVRAQARMDQHIARLRVAEAIRLFALDTGKLPESLDKLTVPVPVDPMNGKPFTYTVADGVATLAGAPYSAPAQARHYRITLAK